MIEKLKKLNDYRGIQRLIEPLPKPGFRQKQTQYASVVDKLEDKIVERVYAFRYKNKKHLEIKEVVRRIEGLDKVLVRDTDFGMWGYRTIWGKIRSSYYGDIEPTHKWHEEDAKYFQLDSFRLFNIDNLIELDESLEYCNYDPKKHGNVIVYINTFRKYPEFELLSKSGLEYFAYSKMLMRKMKTDKEFRSFVLRHKEIIRLRHYNYSMIKLAFDRNTDFKEAVKLYDLQTGLKSYGLLRIFKGKENSFYEYLDKQNKNINYYSDYFKMALEFILEKDFKKDTKYLYPHDLEERHNYYMNLIAERKEKEEQEKYRKLELIAKKYTILEFAKDGLIVFVAPNYNEIVKEGKELNHCVATQSGYIDSFLNEKRLILFIREQEKIDKPFYTVELELSNLKVLQCRTQNN